MFALENTDLFNLLVVTADARGGDVPDAFYSDALDYCVTRRAMLLVTRRPAGEASLTPRPESPAWA